MGGCYGMRTGRGRFAWAFVGLSLLATTCAAFGTDLREVKLPLIPGREIIHELEDLGLFTRTSAFYDGHMGTVYDSAMAVVSRSVHYKKLGDHETYLDPSTEAHESLHGMSSLIRQARGWSISKGYDVIYIGDGAFAAVRVGPGFTKGQLAAWLPRQARQSPIINTHIDRPDLRSGPVALVVEELAYHLLDARIGLENHRYMEEKLGISSAVTVPAIDWSIMALAAATMLDHDKGGFRREQDRLEFNILVKQLVEQSAAAYAQGMNTERYGLLGNLAPELRERFTFLLTEDSRQSRNIRDFCTRSFGEPWLAQLVERVETARETTEDAATAAISRP